MQGAKLNNRIKFLLLYFIKTRITVKYTVVNIHNYKLIILITLVVLTLIANLKNPLKDQKCIRYKKKKKRRTHIQSITFVAIFCFFKKIERAKGEEKRLDTARDFDKLRRRKYTKRERKENRETIDR